MLMNLNATGDDGWSFERVMVNSVRRSPSRAGFSAKLIPNDIIEVKDEAAIERPNDIATRLVKARHTPTRPNVEQEDT